MNRIEQTLCHKVWHQILSLQSGKVIPIVKNAFPKSSVRYSSTQAFSNREFMETRYKDLKELIYHGHQQVCNVNPSGLFAIHQINLAEIDVYGFDYDYTLAEYSSDMQKFIYDKATEILHYKYNFPDGLLQYEFLPDFCIRGLHYDIQRCLLMKIDASHVIQLGTVFR